MVQLNRLEGFYWVAKTGGYSKAARAFPYPITQPAVYQQVKKLEADVGAKLFERVGKDTLLLTPAGQTLHEFVAPFFAGLQSVLRAIRAGEFGGELRIHAGTMFLRGLLPAWLRRLERRRPDVRVDLQEMEEEFCTPLETGEADLIVSHLPNIPDGIESKRVATIYGFLVLPEDHRLARRKRINVRDLRDEVFVGYRPGTLRQRLQLEELARSGVTPQRTVAATSADTILGFVESGIGYSLIPSLHPDGPRLKGIVARPLPGKRHHYPVYAAWRKSSASNPLLEAALATAPTP
jgi:DNA-binding transcriptional LysR family regulator